MKFQNVDQATEAVSAFITMTKSVHGYDLKDPIPDMVNEMASAIEVDRTDEAIELAGKIVSIGRSMLGRFIRFSVQDRLEGAETRVARFRWQIDQLIEQNYEEDITDGLEKLFLELSETVSVELNGTFERRIAGYNALSTAIDKAKLEQAERDKKRKVSVKVGFTSPRPIRSRRGVDHSPQAVEARKAKASALTSLLK